MCAVIVADHHGLPSSSQQKSSQNTKDDQVRSNEPNKKLTVTIRQASKEAHTSKHESKRQRKQRHCERKSAKLTIQAGSPPLALCRTRFAEVKQGNGKTPENRPTNKRASKRANKTTHGQRLITRRPWTSGGTVDAETPQYSSAN